MLDDEVKIFTNFLLKDPTPGKTNRLIRKGKIYQIPGWVFDKTEEFIEIPYKALNRRLIKIGFNSQIVYDILVLGLTDLSNRPKCPICNNPIRFESLNRGYFKTCGNSSCVAESIKYSVVNLWKDEKYRNIQINSHKLWASKDENLEKMRQVSLKTWQNDNYRKLQIQAHRAWANKKENLEKMRQIAISLWKNKDYQEKQTRSHKEFARNNPNKIKNGISGEIISNKSFSNYLNFDSSWEREFILVVNSLSDIVSIERAGFYIPYSIENNDYFYFPDFKIVFNTGKRVLVEIKARWMIEHDEKTKYKIEAGFKYVKESKDFDEYLLLMDEHFCDAPHYVNINQDLIKIELLKYKN